MMTRETTGTRLLLAKNLLLLMSVIQFLCFLTAPIATKAFTITSSSPGVASFPYPLLARTTTRPLFSATEAGTGESGAAADDDDDDDEFHAVDAAQSTTQFLSGLWQLIAQGNHMTRGVSLQ